MTKKEEILQRTKDLLEGIQDMIAEHIDYVGEDVVAKKSDVQLVQEALELFKKYDMYASEEKK